MRLPLSLLLLFTLSACGFKLVGALENNPMGRVACWSLAGATFVATAWLRWPLAWVLLGLGGAACLWAYRVLGRSVNGSEA